MTAALPYVKQPSGIYGVFVDPITELPLAVVPEVFSALPLVTNPDNFNGRLVFNSTDQTLYVFRTLPTANWRALNGIPVFVGSDDPPPSIPTPPTGALQYSNATQLLYMWDGAVWQQVGGAFGVTVLSRVYVGDGVTDTFSTGASQVLPAQFIEVVINGIVQTPTVDYISLGNNIQFITPPPAATTIFLRSSVAQRLIQNSQILNLTYTGDGFATLFSTGAIGTTAASVIVTVNGLVKSPVIDYNIVAQNTTITSLTRTLGVATAITAAPHGLGSGMAITIGGAAQPGWNQSYTILTASTPTSFTFAVDPTTPTPATPSPTVFFQPAAISDKVQFVVAPVNGTAISIRAVQNVVTAPSPGEVNIGSNLGSGVGLYASKSGIALQFKSLTDGANTHAVDNGDGTFRVDVISLNLFDTRVAVNTILATFTAPLNASYIGVTSVGGALTIDLSAIPQAVQQAGRHLVIGDETGNASVNNITITSTAKINNSSNPIVINTNYGFFDLRYDGFNWFIRGRG